MTIELKPSSAADDLLAILVRPRMDAIVARRIQDARAKGFTEPLTWGSWTHHGLTRAFPIFPDHNDPDRRREHGSP